MSHAMQGATLRHYSILHKLGEGGMGVVYKARDLHLDRFVAVKVLPPDKVSDPERKRRFVKEAKAASALNHPNIITIYDIDSDNATDFIAMEYVEGRTLDHLIGGAGLNPHDAIRYSLQIADALAAAHTRGIIHRDLKPANVMVAESGVVKVLDFGLAKLMEPVNDGSTDATQTADEQTVEGAILGTVAYMSPEQAEGAKLDGRSDVFSFGSVLYEMVTGRRAFEGGSKISVLSAILRSEPRPVHDLVQGVPPELEEIIARCLQKQPEQRFQQMSEVKSALRDLQLRSVPGSVSVDGAVAGGRRRAKLATALGVALGIIAFAVIAWLWQRSRNIAWAHQEAIPEIRRLTNQENFGAAFALAERAQKHIPKDLELTKLWSEISLEISIDTEPSGATIRVRPYDSDEQSWRDIGISPVVNAKVPRGFLRLNALRTNHVASDGLIGVSTATRTFKLKLFIEGKVPAGMVGVAGITDPLMLTSLDHIDTVPIGDYYIDRYEVTNRQFKEFVTQGGYRRREFWKIPFVQEGRTLIWEQAIDMFRDKTGRPGPATWELGDFSAGQDEYPVTGVSWYEAAAYAEFAGKSLPTIFHWTIAAAPRAGAVILPLSNFNGKGPAAAGTHRGIGPFGTFDMAGNVKEWCWNEAKAGSGKRYILGGAWNEPVYMFGDPDAQSAFDRAGNYGFRCVKYLDPTALPPASTGPVEPPSRDYDKEKPVPDETFKIYRSFYSYDRGPLDVAVEQGAEEEHWRTEKITFNAAYGGERMFAYLFLPKGAAPPYQAVIYYPGSGVLRARSSRTLPTSSIDFIIRSGRAVMFPVYKSSFERGDGLLSDRPNTTSVFRDHVIQWYKDFARSVDYLETRSDIDAKKLAYYGTSWGGVMGAIIPALEKRIQASVLVVGGLFQQRTMGEVEQINFAPRVTTPVLMLNGRYDFVFPVESSQLPLFRLLGTPEKDKRHILFNTGHRVPRNDLIRETLNWFDQYLGSVK